MSTQETQAGAQAQAAPKHTPGPWVANGATVSDGEQYDSRFVAITYVSAGWTTLERPEIDEAIANAKLIASAPSLAAENERVRAELAETKAQRDALLEDMNQIAMRANFMLVRDPMNNQADYILQQAKAAMARCEEEEKAEAGK